MENNKYSDYPVFEDRPLSVVSDMMVAYKATSKAFTSDYDLIQLARKGISKKSMLGLLKNFGFSLKDMAKALPITERSIQRYKPTDKFSSDVSERVIEISQLYAYGYAVFGEKEKFHRWMNTVIPVIGYVTPKSLLDTSFGIALIQNTLGSIEHGILA